MRFMNSGSGKIRFLSVLCLLCLPIFAQSVVGQKVPSALKLDVDTDDKRLCGSSTMSASEFCDYYKRYTDGDASADDKRTARNDMIELVKGQVNVYYKMRKEGRKTKVKWFQVLFDFLEIGAATTIGIMNGERGKTVLGTALGGFQGQRTALTKNFEILQTQVLINKMDANRATVMTGIVASRSRGVDDYSWYAAKNDLRDYLLAGTFNYALDSLVYETGAEVDRAERVLRVVEARNITPPSTRAQQLNSKDARQVKDSIDADLDSNDAQRIANATNKLKAIVTELEKDDDLAAALRDDGISSASQNGREIYDALQLLIGELPEKRGGRGRELADKINQAFIKNK